MPFNCSSVENPFHFGPLKGKTQEVSDKKKKIQYTVSLNLNLIFILLG